MSETADKAAPTKVFRSEKMIEAVAAFALAQAEIERTKPIIIETMGEHALAKVGNHIVKVSRSVGSLAVPAKKITKDMIGQVIPGKRANGAQTRLTVS